MSLMREYLDKERQGWNSDALKQELKRLITEYNKRRSTYLFVYCAAFGKQIPDVSLVQDDFFIFHDMLLDKKINRKSLDIYLETPGGSGVVAEEIVRFLRNNYETINFVISGEAKSAGTLMALSGDNILMTETGSLGPIDAQIRIGRFINSAYDYMEWVEEKHNEAKETQALNPFDATIIAQISPGELNGVSHALSFAKDLAEKWLINYKFKNWSETETRKIKVTDEMKQSRAEEISKELINHGRWRLHGRSIKIQDLEDLGLKIEKIDDDTTLANIIYRIQTVCRLLFSTTTIYKIFSSADANLARQALPAGLSGAMPLSLGIPSAPDVAEVVHKCQNCGEEYRFFAKFKNDKKIDSDFTLRDFLPFPKDAKLKCNCGFETDLSGLKNQIETQVGKKIL